MSRIYHPAYMRPLTLSWLRRLFSPAQSDASQHAARRYEVAFEAAQARSLLWGLHRPRFDPTSTLIGLPATVAKVEEELRLDIGSISVDMISSERFGITAAIRGPLERTLRIPLTYTLGYVQQGALRLRHTPLDELERMLLAGYVDDPKINLHVWLTLPSHEIIDVSYWAAFPHMCSRNERESRVLFMRSDQMEGRSYHPQLIGDEFVRKIGALKEYEGW